MSMTDIGKIAQLIAAAATLVAVAMEAHAAAEAAGK